MNVDWQEISREYGPVVWRTAYRLVGHGADAADCFQDTFVSALDVARREEVRNWGGLLQRLATARGLDVLRRRKREAVARGAVADWDEVAAGGQAPPEQRAIDTELMTRLREALTRLPAAQAEAFCLRHLSDLSYDEIARQTGATTDNVGVLLHRARARLRELLTPSGAFRDGEGRCES